MKTSTKVWVCLLLSIVLAAGQMPGGAGARFGEVERGERPLSIGVQREGGAVEHGVIPEGPHNLQRFVPEVSGLVAASMFDPPENHGVSPVGEGSRRMEDARKRTLVGIVVIQV